MSIALIGRRPPPPYTLSVPAATKATSNITTAAPYADPSTTSRPDLRSYLTAAELREREVSKVMERCIRTLEMGNPTKTAPHTSRPDLRSYLTAAELELICEGCNMTAAAWVRRGGGSNAAAPRKPGAACNKNAWNKHCYYCRIAHGVKASANGR